MKCDKCGEIIEDDVIIKIEKNAIEKQSEIRYSVLKYFVDREEINQGRQWIISFIKLESLGLILYYTSIENWNWKWVFATCVVVFTMFNNRRFRTIYVICLSLALGYIIPFNFLPIEKNHWWYAIFITIISLIFHLLAFTKEEKISDIMN